jgi:hypothetical protein
MVKGCFSKRRSFKNVLLILNTIFSKIIPGQSYEFDFLTFLFLSYPKLDASLLALPPENFHFIH